MTFSSPNRAQLSLKSAQGLREGNQYSFRVLVLSHLDTGDEKDYF